MPNPLTTVREIVSDLAFFARLAQPTPERNRRRARRKSKRARKALRRGDKDKAFLLDQEAWELRHDADKLARGE